LILPGSQGATFLYAEYLEPLLYHHEREIDDFITETHDRARSAGLQYVSIAIEWVKVNVLGFPPTKKAESPRPGQTYAQSFMTRFTMPGARGDNLTNLVSQALSGASALYTGNTGAQAEQVRSGANLVPDNIRNTEDRLSYVASQRERLASLLQAFDKEQDNIRTARDSGSRYYEGSGASGLSRNRSEGEFDRIERDELGGGGGAPPYPITPPALDRRTSQGSWMPWGWRQQAPPPPRQVDEDPLAYGKEPGAARGRSSGFEFGDR
jgi:receptor expression-enhancing protein 1/2/3/4